MKKMEKTKKKISLKAELFLVDCKNGALFISQDWHMHYREDEKVTGPKKYAKVIVEYLSKLVL